MPGFQKIYEIHYYQIDQNREATPASILHFLEDVATSHSESVGLGIDRLLEARTGWVLNHWFLRMERYPRFGEKILVQTWPSKFEHFYATRQFNIEDSEGRRLGQASSLWIYLSLDTKHPLRIPQHFEAAYGLDSSRSMDVPFQKYLKLTGVDAGVNFHVRRSDIDTNGHVNNVRYFDWMVESIPEDLTRDHQLSELEIIYKKETLYGANILSECQRTNDEQPEYLHRILDETKEHELAQGRTVWKKRSSG